MARFEVQTPDGKTFDIEAENLEAATRTLQQFTSQPPPAPAPVTIADASPAGKSVPAEFATQGEDLARSFAGGVRKGVVSLPGLPGSLEHLGRAGINWAGRRMGAQGDTVSPNPVLPSAARYRELDENLTPEA